MKKRFIRLFLSLILFVSFFYITKDSTVLGVGYDDIDIQGIAKNAIENGYGGNVINDMLDNGLLGDSVLEHNYNGFAYKFSKNSHFYFASEAIGVRNRISYKSFYDEADSYYQTIFDIYESVANELKKNPDMDWFFDRAARYAGLSDDEYAESIIESVTIEIVNQKVLEFEKTYRSSCDGKYSSTVAKFKYNDKSYSCSDVYYEYGMFGKEFGTQTFYENFGIQMTIASNSNLNYTSGNLSDTTAKKVQENKYYIGKQGNYSDYNMYDEDGNLLMYFYNRDANYTPNLINAVKFSKNLASKGDLPALTNSSNKNNFVGIVKTTVEDVGKYGTYVMYAIILFLGVKMIWSGINGRVQFAETLPYLAIAIVLFYAAPGAVDLISQIFGDAQSINNQIPKIFNLVVNLVRILAFCGIIFNGIKIMFKGVEGRANLKASVIPIFVGCVIVFGASFVVEFTVNAAKGVGINTEINTQNTV